MKLKQKPTREEFEQYLITMNDYDIAELLGVGRSRVQQLRKEYGLPPSRIPQGLRQGHLEGIVSREDLAALLVTMNDNQIATHLGVSYHQVRTLRNKYGLAASTIPVPTNRVHAIDHTYFQVIDTPKKAYILGFLIADGSVSKDLKRLSVGVADRDIAILYIIRDEIGSTQLVYLRTAAGSTPFKNTDLYGLQFHSMQLVQDIMKLGVVPNKTDKTYLPAIDPALQPHLIRGILEGDGYLDATRFAILGTQALIQGIHATIQDRVGMSLNYGVSPNSRNALYRITGYRRNQAALNWIYHDSDIISLARKRERWLTHWQ